MNYTSVRVITRWWLSRVCDGLQRDPSLTAHRSGSAWRTCPRVSWWPLASGSSMWMQGMTEREGRFGRCSPSPWDQLFNTPARSQLPSPEREQAWNKGSSLFFGAWQWQDFLDSFILWEFRAGYDEAYWVKQMRARDKPTESRAKCVHSSSLSQCPWSCWVIVTNWSQTFWAPVPSSRASCLHDLGLEFTACFIPQSVIRTMEVNRIRLSPLHTLGC